MKKAIKSILILLLVLAIGIALVACVEPDLDDEEPGEEGGSLTRSQLITNGTFYDVSNATGSKNYIKENVAGWNLTTGTVSRGTDGVAAGAIDMANKELFERERNKFNLNNTLQYPGVDPSTPKEKDDPTKLQDTNALLLSSIKTAGSIHYKNSNDFTLQANKYYKLQFSVLTDIDLTDVSDEDKAKKGAWVIFDGAIYQEFPSINTNGQWETYEIYIQSSDYDATRSLKVRLWLGHGPDKIRDVRDSTITNPYLTKGTALFDNIICEEITDFTAADFNQMEETDFIKKSSMIFPDMNFVQQNELSTTSSPEYFYSFRSGTNSSSNAVNYNLIEGKTGLTANKPSVNRSYTGIVDMSKMYRFDASLEGDKRYIDTYQYDFKKTTFFAPERSHFMSDEGIFRILEGRESVLSDTKALMIYHNDLSGAGFVSNKQLLIRKNSFYTIKVWAYVWEIDIPEPTSTDVGTQPTAPTKPEPNQEGVDAAKLAYDIAKADYEWKKVSLGEIELNDITDDSIRQRVHDLSQDPAEVTRLTEASRSDLKDEHDKYYSEYDIIFKLFEDWQTYNQKNSEYLEKVAAYNEKYNQWKGANSKPYAQFKVTGAGDLEPVKTTTTGQWEELIFYINGNQLSDRKVNLEFWFGEGTNVDYADLMMGGVFFDNISIEVSDAPESGKENLYQELSPFTDKDISEGNVDVGGLFGETGDIKFSNDETLTEAELWEKLLVDGAALSNKEYLNYSIINDQTYPIKIGDETKYYNLLKMENLDYTAGILNFRGEREILANKCYRLSLWAWTEDIDKGLGAKIELMAKEKGSDGTMASVSSFTDFNNANGQELVFYVRGDTLKNNLVGLRLSLGEGNRFNTERYIKGALYVSAITIKEIEFTEYNATSKSGDQIKSYAFANTATSPAESVTNANFGSIKLEDIDKDAINDKGELVGVAPTSSWTLPTSASITTNGYNKPLVSYKKIDDKDYIEWKHVVNANGERAQGYEVFILNTLKSDDEGGKDKDVDSLYIGYVGGENYYKTEGEGSQKAYLYRFEIVSKAKGNFVVRGVSDNAIGTRSDSLSNPVTTGADYFTEYTDTAERKYKIGTINYLTYGKTDEAEGIYKDSMFANSSYKSPYQTMLMMESNYGIRANVTAASKSLSADTFYEISVWVKTLNGAKASISFKDLSEILETRDEQVGFINQDTNGKWVQYRFYVATGAQSSSIQLQLSMGNPYGKGVPGTETQTTRMYGDELSKGIIFFDNVNIRTLTAEQYEARSTKQTDGGNDGEYYTGNEVFHDFEMVYTNQFAYKVLSYTTDSFDSFTENTVLEEFDTDGKYREGFYRGHTPKAYSWSRATDGSTTDMDRLYGVYSYLDIQSNDHPLMTNDKNPDAFSSLIKDIDNFSLANFIRISGYNSLVLSNLVDNGQMYTLTSSRTLSANTHYKLTFKAKTLLAEGDYAEFRYMYDGDNQNYKVIKINTGNSVDEYVEYTMYIYNETDLSKSIKWAFSLGGDAVNEKIKGMLVIDDVRLEKVDKTIFEDAHRAFGELNEEAKELSAVQFYNYEKEDGTPGGDDPGTDPPKRRESIFDRGGVWLLVSTIIIGMVIIVTVVVVLFKRFKKKHPKKVKGENVVKTEKVIEVAPAQSAEKEDIVSEDEFVDKAETEKPKYTQRVLPKKKKKKK